MGKLLIAFVAGLAVAALLLNLFSGPTSSPSDRSDNVPVRQSIEMPNVESGASDAAREGRGTTSGFTEVEPYETPEAAELVSELPPPELPIHYPAEFDWIAEDPILFRAFDGFQREPYDVNWAPGMEAQIAQFLRENPEITQEYGNPILNCRTTKCELAFVAYGLDATVDDIDVALMSHFTASLSDAGFFERPEFEEFSWPALGDHSIFFNYHTENGVTSMRWQLASRDRLEKYSDPDAQRP